MLKDIIYFIVVFLSLFTASKISPILSKRFKGKGDLGIIILAVIFTGILALLFYLLKMCKVCDTCESPKCDDCSKKEKFTVDPPRQLRCMNKALIQSEDIAYCNKLSPKSLNEYGCPNPMMGRPHPKFVYTPLSDNNWENNTCS